MGSSDKYVQIANTSEGGRVARKAAQLILREELQLYSLGDEPLPHKAQQSYTHSPKDAHYKNSLPVLIFLL
jgi:hypothetical protein